MDIGEKMLTSHGEYLRWAGYDHGYVTETEYHQLGKSNQLKLGSQTWNFLGQTLQGAATSLYKALPDELEQAIEEKGRGNIKRPFIILQIHTACRKILTCRKFPGGL